MTEQNVDELIAEARKLDYPYDWENTVERLADALEAEHERAEAAETQARLNDRAFRNAVDRRVAVEAERDAACAVVEQAKATAEHYHDVDMFDLLSIVPADALRDVKAQAMKGVLIWLDRDVAEELDMAAEHFGLEIEWSQREVDR